MKAGVNAVFSPHHVVQDAVSTVSHGKGITINLTKAIHALTGTYRRPVRDLVGLRSHLAADIFELRKLLSRAGYDQKVINSALKELIRQNKALGGFTK